MNQQFLMSLVICNALAFIIWVIAIICRRSLQQDGFISSLLVRKWLLLFTLVYLASIFSITLVPLTYSTNRLPVDNDLNFIPLVTTAKTILYPFRNNRMALMPDIIVNVFGNILLFMPMGWLLPLISKRFLSARRTILTGFGCAFLIELAQLVSRLFGNYRHVDVDDIILNTLGTAIGFVLFIWICRPGRKRITEESP